MCSIHVINIIIDTNECTNTIYNALLESSTELAHTKQMDIQSERTPFRSSLLCMFVHATAGNGCTLLLFVILFFILHSKSLSQKYDSIVSLLSILNAMIFHQKKKETKIVLF